MMTVEQFCGAVESLLEGAYVNVERKQIVTWGGPVYQALKGSGLRVPRVIKDACDGKLTDAAARAARRKLELYFFGEGPKAVKFRSECHSQSPLATA